METLDNPNLDNSMEPTILRQFVRFVKVDTSIIVLNYDLTILGIYPIINNECTGDNQQEFITYEERKYVKYECFLDDDEHYREGSNKIVKIIQLGRNWFDSKSKEIYREIKFFNTSEELCTYYNISFNVTGIVRMDFSHLITRYRIAKDNPNNKIGNFINNLWIEFFHINFKPQGKYIEYDFDDEKPYLQYEINFINGIPHGPYYYKYESNDYQCYDDIYKCQTNYNNGKIDGRYIKKYNSRKFLKIYFKNGIRENFSYHNNDGVKINGKYDNNKIIKYKCNKKIYRERGVEYIEKIINYWLSYSPAIYNSIFSNY
jgi:hypothetical protein